MPLLGRPPVKIRERPSQLPPNIRYVVGLERYTHLDLAILEDPPGTRSILYKPGSATMPGDARRYTVRKPWSYLLVCTAIGRAEHRPDCILMFAKKQAVDLHDPVLVMAPTPNVTYGSGGVYASSPKCCLGYDVAFGNVIDVAEELNRRLWASVFNDEYHPVFTNLPSEIESTYWAKVLDKWESLDKEPTWKIMISEGVPINSLGQLIHLWRGPFYFRTEEVTPNAPNDPL